MNKYLFFSPAVADEVYEIVVSVEVVRSLALYAKVEPGSENGFI